MIGMFFNIGKVTFEVLSYPILNDSGEFVVAVRRLTNNGFEFKFAHEISTIEKDKKYLEHK